MQLFLVIKKITFKRKKNQNISEFNSITFANLLFNNFMITYKIKKAFIIHNKNFK